MFRFKKVKLFVVFGIAFLMMSFFAIQPKLATSSAISNIKNAIAQSSVSATQPEQFTYVGSEFDGFGHKWDLVTKSSTSTISTMSDDSPKTYRLINSAADLRAIEPLSIDITDSDVLNGMKSNLSGDYVLNADITVSDWVPIGVSEPFTGSLDGNGYQISYVINYNKEMVTLDSDDGEIDEYRIDDGYFGTGVPDSACNNRGYASYKVKNSVFSLFGKISGAEISNLAVNVDIDLVMSWEYREEYTTLTNVINRSHNIISGGLAAICETDSSKSPTIIKNCHIAGDIFSNAKYASPRRQAGSSGGYQNGTGQTIGGLLGYLGSGKLVIQNCLCKTSMYVYDYCHDLYSGSNGNDNVFDIVNMGGMIGHVTAGQVLIEKSGYYNDKNNTVVGYYGNDASPSQDGSAGHVYSYLHYNALADFLERGYIYKSFVYTKTTSFENFDDSRSYIDHFGKAHYTIDSIIGGVSSTDIYGVTAHEEIEAYLNSQTGIDWLNGGDSMVDDFLNYVEYASLDDGDINNNPYMLNVGPSTEESIGGGGLANE